MRSRFLAAALLVAGLGSLTLAGCSNGTAAVDVDAARASAPPGAPVVAFYGDSYTLGTGASDPSKRWSTVISTGRGWAEVNPSVNGLGFVNNRTAFGGGDLVEQVIDAEPDIVFVTMGLNDNFSMPQRADDIQAAITDDFDRLATALPDARFVVVQPFWYTDDQPESLTTISDWVHAAADDLDARGLQVDWIDGAMDWIRGHPEWMASDGLHPNDEGYAAMTVRMDEALDAIGL